MFKASKERDYSAFMIELFSQCLSTWQQLTWASLHSSEWIWNLIALFESVSWLSEIEWSNLTAHIESLK